jgi:hypothetical protein
LSLGELINKSVRFGPISKARAKKIHRLTQGNTDLGTILLDIYSCYERAKHWNKLSRMERIMLEQKWTDLMLELLKTGNGRVMHSLQYRLREQTPEEDEEQSTCCSQSFDNPSTR